MKKSSQSRYRLVGCFLLTILLFSSIYGQPQFPAFLYSEVHIFSADSSIIIYYSYKIPNSKLVFEKAGDKYNAGFRIAIEVIDSSSNSVTRQIKEKKIIAENFEQTNDNNIYTEGLIEFKLPAGNYSLLPIVTDLNSQREIRNKSINIISKEYSEHLSPLIVKSNPIECNNLSSDAKNKENSLLANFEGNFPFNEEEYDLIIPLKDTTKNTLYATIINNEDTVFNDKIEESFISSLSLEECDGKIILRKNGGTATKNFLLKKISTKLYEGNLVIHIFYNKAEKATRIYAKQVEWYNKPISLAKPEFALKMLKYIESDSVVDEMLSNKSAKYSSILFEYWKKYDPTPNTSFNQLMAEYYSRVDYAALNFSTITGKNGVDSDRGRVFIQLGKPKKIERASNEYGKIVETWIYDNPEKSGQRKFVFVDERGTGEFSLKNG